MTKPFALKASYANRHGGINAYDSPDERGRESLKEAFLRDGKALLRRAVAPFYLEGWKARFVTNRAGIAVSGENYCYLTHSDKELGLFISVEGSSLRGNGMGRDSDGAMILVQIRNRRGQIEKGNFYISADLDSLSLYHQLESLVKKCQ